MKSTHDLVVDAGRKDVRPVSSGGEGEQDEGATSPRKSGDKAKRKNGGVVIGVPGMFDGFEIHAEDAVQHITVRDAAGLVGGHKRNHLSLAEKVDLM